MLQDDTVSACDMAVGSLGVGKGLGPMSQLRTKYIICRAQCKREMDLLF